MEQHPIPQNVSSYQFKLVGDMTLKQFFQVAGGILIAILLYSSPLLPIIKWPLAGISALLGVGLAFLPLEERPLEKWIFAFFRAIYSPTLFTWKRSEVAAKFFQDETPEAAVSATPQDAALKNYLTTTSQVQGSTANLDKAESGFFTRLSGIFSGASAAAVPAVANLPVTPPPPVTPSPQIAATPTPPHPFMVNQSTVAAPATPEQTQSASQPQPLKIPETPLIKIESNVPRAVVEEQTPNIPFSGQIPSNQVAPIIAGNEMISTKQAMFSVDAAPPSPPTYPNVVVGQVVDQDRRIVEGAIMEIRDSAGRPIRALRSNKVGHFITVTQLDSGHYEIITEKDGYEFTPVSFDATGALIPPILVTGKRLSPLIAMPEVPVKPLYSIN